MAGKVMTEGDVEGTVALLDDDGEDLTPVAVRRRDDTTFDDGLKSIMRRAKQHARENPGEPEYDPQTMKRVWMKPNGHGGHTPVLRPVTLDLAEAQAGGNKDFYHRFLGCWLRNGQKRESDSDAYREDNLVAEE